MAGPPKRSKIQQERDRVTIAELYLKGWSQGRIGEYLELDQSTICRELKKVKQAWKEEAVRDYSLHIGEQMRRLALVESEYWSGWERSQTAKEQSLQEKLTEAATSGDSRAKIQRRTETRVGDVRFLEGIVKIVQERSKLLDLYPASDREFNNATAIGRNSSSGLSGDTVDAIRAQIWGVTYGEPAGAEPSNIHPAALPTEVAGGQKPG